MTYREVDGVSVVALDGRIVLGEESNALREKVKSLIAEGKKKIVLNMDNITFIDSAGLGTLVAAHHSVKTQGASLRLCHLGSKFQEVLQITDRKSTRLNSSHGYISYAVFCLKKKRSHQRTPASARWRRRRSTSIPPTPRRPP